MLSPKTQANVDAANWARKRSLGTEDGPFMVAESVLVIGSQVPAKILLDSVTVEWRMELL
jgi:hypothetical protein